MGKEREVREECSRLREVCMEEPGFAGLRATGSPREPVRNSDQEV